jgi:hypothetical protein
MMPTGRTMNDDDDELDEWGYLGEFSTDEDSELYLAELEARYLEARQQ